MDRKEMIRLFEAHRDAEAARDIDAILDACAAAYAARALAEGGGSWVGDPREGVIVLPVPELADRYDKLPPPARTRLA